MSTPEDAPEDVITVSKADLAQLLQPIVQEAADLAAEKAIAAYRAENSRSRSEGTKEGIRKKAEEQGRPLPEHPRDPTHIAYDVTEAITSLHEATGEWPTGREIGRKLAGRYDYDFVRDELVRLHREYVVRFIPRAPNEDKRKRPKVKALSDPERLYYEALDRLRFGSLETDSDEYRELFAEVERLRSELIELGLYGS